MNIRNSSDGKPTQFSTLELGSDFQPHADSDGLQKMTTSTLVKTQHLARSDRIEFLGAKSNVIMACIGAITPVSPPEKSGLSLEHHLTDDPRLPNDLIIRERHLASLLTLLSASSKQHLLTPMRA
jgi:hypothetical protein